MFFFFISCRHSRYVTHSLTVSELPPRHQWIAGPMVSLDIIKEKSFSVFLLRGDKKISNQATSARRGLLFMPVSAQACKTRPERISRGYMQRCGIAAQTRKFPTCVARYTYIYTHEQRTRGVRRFLQDGRRG